MKTHYLVSGGENDDIFRSMMWFLDSLELTDEAQIYVNSSGGSCWMYDSFLSRLNSMTELWYKIKMIILFAWSAAFDLTWKYKGERVTEQRSDAIVHIAATDVAVWRWTIRESSNTEIERMKYNDAQEQYIYPFLTEEEQVLFLEWRDIYINPDRMREIFEKK
jgi:hypothetical protein